MMTEITVVPSCCTGLVSDHPIGRKIHSQLSYGGYAKEKPRKFIQIFTYKYLFAKIKPNQHKTKAVAFATPQVSTGGEDS